MMMSNKYTAAELASKVDWEGGVTEAITGYGIPPEALPDDAPEDIKQAWTRIWNMRDDISLVERWLDDALADEDTTAEDEVNTGE